MQVPVFDLTAKEVGNQDLNDTVFGIEPNVPVMHQAHLRQRANARLGTSDTLTRGRVRGGGRKPWRQKGTGRARQGSIRSPQWRGGGVVFGPHPRSYAQDMPKKMRRLAIRSVLSVKAIDEQIVVIKGLNDIEPKAKTMMELLAQLPASRRSTLIVIGPEGDYQAVYRAAGNLEGVKIIRSGYVNIHDVLTHERLLLTTEAVESIHGLWALN
ncbi:MAG: 50S ribosomal protein L4 [Chloroflexia bacterium]|jgi:large subunit ribosomal protein L4|nr:50S ribosomal protein L4 [Chloroflexia bacterium]